MESVEMPINGTWKQQEVCPDSLSFARSYQLEALEKAIKQNTIVFLETGSGKTLIAIMLLRSYAHFLRKPSPFIAVFLVPTVVLVTQQADAVKMHTDLKVGKYWGEMGVDFWDAATWKQQQDEYEVLVMTPVILLDALRHSFLQLDMIKVLIFDECHNARGRHPYACIMMEFYHRQLVSKSSQLPRIFGMTASPIKAKGSSSGLTYWKQISELENLMNSKVYTCVSESVLAEHIPFSTAKVKMYKHKEIPYALFESIVNDLSRLREKHESALKKSNLSESSMESAKKRLSKLYSMFFYCLSELGAWLALKAAESLLSQGTDIFSWTKLDVCGETIVKDFTSGALSVFSAYIPSGPEWSIGSNIKANVDVGYLTTKVLCLLESLEEYRSLKDLRCIVFVERVIAAIVIQSLLRELLPKQTGWQTEYTAGNNSGYQMQNRSTQNKIVEEFRKGTVNIIVATSILEEGLDVQSCNLVIRFDPSANVCSFIQSRGRARMQNSDFLSLVKSGDASTLNRVENYLASGDIMRQESLRHASLPCVALDNELCNEVMYRVESTGAVVTLSSSVALVYFYCSRLPSDGYFKPSPRCVIEKESGKCVIYFPKSCPLPSVTVSGNVKMLKQLACLEACKQLHLMGALTNNLVPDIVVEEAEAAEYGSEPYVEEQAKYIPPELVNQTDRDAVKQYHCYSIKMGRDFEYDVPLQDVVLALNSEIEFDDAHLDFDLEVDRGNISIFITYVGAVSLKSEQVLLCQRFQVTMFGLLLDHNLEKMKGVLEAFHMRSNRAVFDYLLLPSNGSREKPSIIDWVSVSSVLFSHDSIMGDHINCPSRVHTKNGLISRCKLKNSLVYTPHNGFLYCITGPLHNLNGNSLFKPRDGEAMTYKQYYEKKHGVKLQFETESFFRGRQVFVVQNYLQRCRPSKEKGSSKSSVELPPELCYIIMSPISVSTFYSFSFVPSIMHRVESFIVALNLKKMCTDHCKQNVDIPTIKVLEAITTKKCQEKFHLESLETLGDSFLKYVTSQELFKKNQNMHEGILTIRRTRIIANANLCKLGCGSKIQGFIRNEPFDPKMWVIPGDFSESYVLDEEFISTTKKVYIGGKRKLKSKVIADVVEALIGAYLSYGGEFAALSFMDWLGIKADFVNTPYERHFPVHPEKLVNICRIELLLNYSFNDKSLLVEALTHGSYMLPEIARCYQRLEFLGDAVLDYLITMYLYETYPGLSPGELTDLRSASVNNDCYAQSAIKAGLHKHLLHASQDLHRHIVESVHKFEQFSMASTFGWDSETAFPKVLGDVIESLAGAIFVDSGYNKEVVFQSIRPLLEPLVTPETLTVQPIKELNEMCQKKHYIMKKPVVTRDNGISSITVEVEANGAIFKDTCTASNKELAQKLASKAVLKLLKENGLSPMEELSRP